MLSTSLVVEGPQVNTTPLPRRFGLAGDETHEMSEGVGFYAGPGWASLTYDERHSKNADEQAAGLATFLDAHRPELSELKQAGLKVSLDISGVAEPQTEIILSMANLAQLAELEVPVRFTTVREEGIEEEDPLAWLG